MNREDRFTEICNDNFNYLKAEKLRQKNSFFLQQLDSGIGSEDYSKFFGAAVGLMGLNGSGKTIYSALTSPIGKTLFVNLESRSNASIPYELKEYGTLSIDDRSDMVSIAPREFFNSINDVIKASKREIKVIIIDSYRRMVDLFSKHAVSINKFWKSSDADILFKLGNIYNREYIQLFQEFEHSLIKAGMFLFYLCGLESDPSSTEEPLMLQCEIKAARIHFNADLNGKFLLVNPNNKINLIKDNIGLGEKFGLDYREFLASRELHVGAKEPLRNQYGITDLIEMKVANHLKRIEYIKNQVKPKVHQIAVN